MTNGVPGGGGCRLIPASLDFRLQAESGRTKAVVSNFASPSTAPFSPCLRFLTRIGRNEGQGTRRSDGANVSFQLIARRDGIIELEIYGIKIHKLRREIISQVVPRARRFTGPISQRLSHAFSPPPAAPLRGSFFGKLPE